MSRTDTIAADQKQRIAAAGLGGVTAAALFLALNWLLLLLTVRDLPQLGVSFFDAPFAGFIAGVLSVMPLLFIFALPALALAFALIYFARLRAAPLQETLTHGAAIGAALCGGGMFALALIAGALLDAFNLVLLMTLVGAIAGAVGAGVHGRVRNATSRRAPDAA